MIRGTDTGKRRLFRWAASVGVGVGIAAGAVPFIRTMLPSERTRTQGGPVRVWLRAITPGTLLTVKWRGKPVWVLHRTDSMLGGMKVLDERLRDPASKVESQQPSYAQNPTRSIKPEHFVCIGICTHLGCVPTFRPDTDRQDLGAEWPGGFFCPCHGSRFDLAGRVFKGVPAPTNLVVPPHRYESADTIVIGEEV